MQKAGSLWQYYRDEPALTSAGMITNFSAAENSAFFKFKKKKTTGKTAAGGTKNCWNNSAIKIFK